MSKIRIAIDVDGVLRELTWGLYVLLHNNKDIPFQFDSVPSYWKDWHIHKYVRMKNKDRDLVDPNIFYDFWYNSEYTEKLYLSAEEYWTASLQFKRLINDNYAVTILSSQPNGLTKEATTKWLNARGFLERVDGLIYTSDKSLYANNFDIFIEDSPLHITKIKSVNPEATIAMIRRPYNTYLNVPYFYSFADAVTSILKRKTI